jgi:hypothetical protein
MLRKRQRTAAQQALLSYKQHAPIGIGESRDEADARALALEAAVKTAVHEYIWKTRPLCQLCGGARRRECSGFGDEMHEEPPRSATVGKPPEERFNLLVCGRLCKACHRDVTENRLRIVFRDPVRGFLGPIKGERVW